MNEPTLIVQGMTLEAFERLLEEREARLLAQQSGFSLFEQSLECLQRHPLNDQSGLIHQSPLWYSPSVRIAIPLQVLARSRCGKSADKEPSNDGRASPSQQSLARFRGGQAAAQTSQ